MINNVYWHFSMFYCLHILTLSIGFFAVGWFLAAIHAQCLVWLSLASLIVYLVNTQQRGLVLAHGWVAMVISISTVTRIWPSIWPSHIPYHQPRLWAMTVLMIWAIAATLIHLLASSPQLTQQALTQRPVALHFALRYRSLAFGLFPASAKPSTLIFAVLITWVGSAIALGVITYLLGVGLLVGLLGVST